ncbi:hypothetical protein D3C76_921430 [compost metagenome]
MAGNYCFHLPIFQFHSYSTAARRKNRRTRYAPFTFDNLYFIFAHQILYALMKLLNYSFFAFLYLWEYQLYTACLNAIALALIDFSIYLCTTEQRFTRNAAPMQTGSSQFVHFDDDNGLSKLCSANSRHIPSSTSAKYGHVT